MKLSTDNAHDYDYEAIFDKCRYLLNNSLYNSEERRKLEAKIDNMGVDELESFILHLYNNQIDAINSGHNYQQGDILRKLKRTI